jgi:hypothetical protein
MAEVTAYFLTREVLIAGIGQTGTPCSQLFLYGAGASVDGSDARKGKPQAFKLPLDRCQPLGTAVQIYDVDSDGCSHPANMIESLAYE